MWVWIVIAAVLLIGMICLIRCEYEKRHISVEHYHIQSDKITGSDRTFVFLSDLHDNQFGLDNSRLMQAIDEVHPDAVLIGGDMMVCKKTCNIEASLYLIAELSKRYPIYYGDGNHENRLDRERDTYGNLYDRYMEALAAYGVRHLSDTSEDFQDDITITGLDIDKRYYRKFSNDSMPSSYIAKKILRPDSAKFQILLAHSPLFFDAYESWGADLTLSGHFHGGTIRLPVLGGVMTPQYQFFLPYCAGIFEKNSKAMIVSRGLGTHSINIRFNNKPQLVVIHILLGQ